MVTIKNNLREHRYIHGCKELTIEGVDVGKLVKGFFILYYDLNDGVASN